MPSEACVVIIVQLKSIATLSKIIGDDTAPPAARVVAANAILDRGFGKPAQAIRHSGEDGGPVQVHHNVAAFIEEMKRLRKQMEETELQ